MHLFNGCLILCAELNHLDLLPTIKCVSYRCDTLMELSEHIYLMNKGLLKRSLGHHTYNNNGPG